MNTVDKLNNTLGYLTAMSFDKPELSNDLVEPLNTLSEAISEVEILSLSGVSKRYQVTDIQLADWESVAIGDTETNKVVCHFLTENGFDEAVKMANKIADYLNVY